MIASAQSIMNSLFSLETSKLEAQLALARAGFFQRGESVAEWARKRGFRPNAVYQVLHAHALPSRGNAHHIAVALGLKPPPNELQPDRKEEPM